MKWFFRRLLKLVLEHLIECDSIAPVVKPFINRGPRPKSFTHITPSAPPSRAPKQAADHEAVVDSGTHSPLADQVLNDLPCRIRKFLSFRHRRLLPTEPIQP